MSKKALALRVVGDPVTGAEMERIRESVEESLGTDYNVLIYDDAVELMDTEDAIKDLRRAADQLEEGLDDV